MACSWLHLTSTSKSFNLYASIRTSPNLENRNWAAVHSWQESLVRPSPGGIRPSWNISHHLSGSKGRNQLNQCRLTILRGSKALAVSPCLWESIVQKSPLQPQQCSKYFTEYTESKWRCVFLVEFGRNGPTTAVRFSHYINPPEAKWTPANSKQTLLNHAESLWSRTARTVELVAREVSEASDDAVQLAS